MSDRQTPEEARRDSVQEAIEKITGVRPAADKADAAAAGKPYSGEGLHEKVGEAQDLAAKAAKDARDAQADEIKQQGKAIRSEADTSADKLEAQAKQIRADADKRAGVVDDRAKAVRQ